MIASERFGRLETCVFSSRQEMGERAAGDIENEIAALQQQQGGVRMIFAAAPSQNEVLAALVASVRIDWRGITAFHMDEYIGLDPNAPQAFGKFLRERLFDRVSCREVQLLDGCAVDVAAECARYTRLLEQAPIDIVVCGIGENGHVAFNDPHVADFDDPAMVKAVTLDQPCRQQQVNDGCFGQLDEVPNSALTLTVPALMNGKRVFCIVPGAAKRAAVNTTLEGEIGPACPATVLRKHPRCSLYLDRDSWGLD